MDKKIEIIPAILPIDIQEVIDKTIKVENAVPFVQIDLCDGKFTSTSTWPFIRGSLPTFNDDFEMPSWGKLDFEFDLMLLSPEQHIDNIKNMGCSRAVLHIGSTSQEGLVRAATELDAYDVEVGIAITNDTDLKDLHSIIFDLEEANISPYIQVMGISERGKQGQPFDVRTLDTVKNIRTRYANIPLQVDGSVSDMNAASLVAAGVTRLVVGSWLFKDGDTTTNRLKMLKNLL